MLVRVLGFNPSDSEQSGQELPTEGLLGMWGVATPWAAAVKTGVVLSLYHW